MRRKKIVQMLLLIMLLSMAPRGNALAGEIPSGNVSYGDVSSGNVSSGNVSSGESSALELTDITGDADELSDAGTQGNDDKLDAADTLDDSGAADDTDMSGDADTTGDADTSDDTNSPEQPGTSEPEVSPAPEPAPTPESGLVRENGRCRYYQNGEYLTKTWKRVNGRKYYFNKNGNAVVGSVEIKGQYYVFNGLGQLLESKTLKIISIESGRYCVDAKGRPRIGWQVIGNDLYSVKKTGKIRMNMTYQGIRLNNEGAARKNTASKLKIRAIKVLSDITKDTMSKNEKLRAAWRYMTGRRFHYASKYPDLNASGWQKSTALDMLKTRRGNCYSFACAFAALAKEIGYSPVVICGRIHGSRDRARDGMTRHAWVTINGRHYDPEGDFAGWGNGIYGYRRYPITHSIQRRVRF